MSQLSMQDFRKFSDERSNGFGSENSDKRYVGYFSLKNDGDSAVVRFMIDSVDDLNVVFMHTVKVDGRFRAINCLRDPLQPASSCPLCSADNRPKQRIYIPLLSYERDDKGELIAVPRIWERPVFYEKRLSALTSEYGKLSNMLFRIVRNGAAGGTVYPVKFTTVAVPGKNTNAPIVNLTNNVYTSEAEEFNTNALLLLPQTSNAWKPEAVPAPGLEGNADNGSYFLVNCAIYNVAGDEFDEREDTPLWGTKGAHKQAAIPVAINWKQGKKYIYTFIFGEGGGYDPDDPDPEDPDKPDPVLIPITFEVTVDDFVTVANEVDMEVQEGTMTPGN